MPRPQISERKPSFPLSILHQDVAIHNPSPHSLVCHLASFQLFLKLVSIQNTLDSKETRKMNVAKINEFHNFVWLQLSTFCSKKQAYLPFLLPFLYDVTILPP